VFLDCRKLIDLVVVRVRFIVSRNQAVDFFLPQFFQYLQTDVPIEQDVV
jgi:hypothetical protein